MTRGEGVARRGQDDHVHVVVSVGYGEGVV
jgi:hypothetical protein